jgi:hypothetical protein
MSDETLRNSIYQNFNLRETEELVQIWQENKRYEWSDTAFDVIQQILEERGEILPRQETAQKEPPAQPDEDNEEAIKDHNNQPAFYNPQQLLIYADLTSKVAWILLVVSVGTAIWQFTGNLSMFFMVYSFGYLFAILLTKLSTAILYFFLLKCVSMGLHVLMEFEFNSRGVK